MRRRNRRRLFQRTWHYLKNSPGTACRTCADTPLHPLIGSPDDIAPEAIFQLPPWPELASRPMGTAGRRSDVEVVQRRRSLFWTIRRISLVDRGAVDPDPSRAQLAGESAARSAHAPSLNSDGLGPAARSASRAR